MTDEKKKLSKEERKRQAQDEYWRKRQPLDDEYERKLKPLLDELERICREIDAEDDV